ncbi:MAG: AMP-binding protein [Bacteriovoracaceae bacterium]|nr:AMP-binding protein [Bacteriovoracaceae bacterium]
MEKIWYKSYREDLHKEIDPTIYNSIAEIFKQNCEKYKELPAFHNLGKTITYGELEILSKKFASYLQNNLGLKQNARVAIMLPNVLQYPVALFGIISAGMTVVNVNPMYSARELEHQLNDSGAESIVILSNSANVLEKIIKNTGVKNVIITDVGDLLSFPKSMIVNFLLRYIKKLVPKYSLPEAVTFKNVLGLGREEEFKTPVIKREDTAFLQYTGGTTGVAKGAELTHGNIISNILQAKEWIKPSIVEREEIIITPLPLYHIFSLTANLFTYTSIGGLVVLITDPRNIKGFVGELKKWKFTALTGVNTLFNKLVADPDFAQVDFSAFRLALGGGMAVQQDVAQKWKQVTGIPLIEAYGLSETSPAVCLNPLDLKEYNGSIGLPISSTILSIRNDEGKEVPIGEAGELCVQGPQVMKGYWKRPDETKKVMTEDGFFKTGDIAIINDDGYVKLVDRKKDMVIVSGFNVYPNEVEDVVCKHEKVFESAVVGVPDKNSGEAVKLFVVKKDESLTQEELKEYCKKNLAAYKRPRIIEFRPDLPKSNVGKILRKELR